MTVNCSRVPFLAAVLLLALPITFSCGQDPPEGDPSREIALTSLPDVSREVHDAMQSRSYADAIKLIESELAKPEIDAPDYMRYLQATAHTELKDYEAALASFEQLEADHVDSPWLSRSRFGRANVYVLQRQYIKAGEIYQKEAERLLSRGRKDDLAKIYLEFADRYFAGIPTTDPTQARKPDFKQALTYYNEAIKLGPTTKRRQNIDFRIARCHEELEAFDAAINAYEQFIADYSDETPKSGQSATTSQQIEASFRLGSVQLQAHRAAEARTTWQDLIGKWSTEEKGDAAMAINDFLSRAEYRLAHTYGLPKPSTIGDLELAVTVAEKFLANHPDHQLAPKAELEIAQGFAQHSRHSQATDRLRVMIENPAYTDSEQIPIARQMLGQQLLAQGDFNEAIAAWRLFLEKHPTDPKWPEVQKRIVDTEYAKADDARSRKQYVDARTLWETFLNKYPLDPRAPQVLLRFGQMKFAQASQQHEQRVEAALEEGHSAQSVAINDDCKQLFEEAIVDWRRVVAKYPSHNEASHASYMIGVTFEDKLHDLKEALDSYEKVSGTFANRAKARTERLTSPKLVVVTERKFRSNEKPRLKLTTRNLEKVTVKTYRVDMVDYFRKMHLASGVETLDIALIDPDEQFEHTVDDFVQYRQIHQDIELPIDGPGVTAVTVSSEKQEATTMVVVSDLDMIVKASRNELFLYAQNMLTGKPAPGASVLISDGAKVFAETVTGADGIIQKEFDELKSVRDLRVFAVKEGHMASTVNNLNGLDFAVGLTPKGYLYTDRPAYRSGQLVNIKGIVRWVDQDRFTFKPGQTFKLDVYDARGRQLHSKDVALNEYGTINANVILPDSAPQGDYRVHLHRASNGPGDITGALTFETQFKVTEYKLEPILISVDLDKSVYFRGEKVKGTITLKYYYGTPLSGESIEYRFGPDAELIQAKTGDDGTINVEFDTQRFSESQPLKLSVTYPQRGLSGDGIAYLATRGFVVTASTNRDVFINGESFETIFNVADPAGKPVSTQLKVEVFKQTAVRAEGGEKLVESHNVSTNEESGVATQVLSLQDPGIYFVRATGIDRFGNEVSGQQTVRISGDKDSTRLRILTDQFTYNVGDEASLNVHWREKPALALVTFEGAKVLGHKLFHLNTGDNELKLPMVSAYAPNFFLSVAVMQRNQFHSAQSELRVAQKLNVTIRPHQNQLKPGEDLTVDIAVSDPQGNPVQAELSLALIQSNLLKRFSDAQGAVHAFFGTGTRKTSVRQSTSCTFNYRPQTRGVSQFLLAEAERRATLEREVRALVETSSGNTDAAAVSGMKMDFDFAIDNDSDGHADYAWADGVNFEAYNYGIAGGAMIGGALGGGGYGRGAGQGEPFGNTITQIREVPVTTMTTQTKTRRVPVQKTRQETRTREVPVTTMRSVVRDGHTIQVPVATTRTESYQVTVPYTEMVEQSYTVQVPVTSTRTETYQLSVPYFEQNQQNYRVVTPQIRGQQSLQFGNTQSLNRIPGNRVNGRDPANVVDFDSNASLPERYQWFSNRDFTVNGLTRNGQFLAVNGRGKENVQKMIREEGLQLLPTMAQTETAFWDPTIVTDESGKALVTITMPARSTAWRLRAKGVNGETLAGESTADLVTKKDLFGEIKLPLVFTVGDQANISVEVHNALDGARGITVKLKITMGDKSTEQTRSIDVQGPGISDVSFPVEIEEADQALFELTVSNGDDISDTTARTVGIRDFGFPVYQTASGTSAQSTLAMIDFDSKLVPAGVQLDLVVGPDVNRSLIESITDGGLAPMLRCGLPNANPIERITSDVLGGIGLLKMIGSARNPDTPEAMAVTGRITAAISQLVSTQQDAGGWSWTGNPATGQPAPLLSARIMWALSAAQDAGFAIPQVQMEKGRSYLKKSFASTAQTDLEKQIILLHAMAVSGCGDFAFANRLYRERNRLSVSGLTHLALTLVAMNHKEMASELIELVKLPTGNETLDPAVRQRILPWMRNRVELQAIYLLALQSVSPRRPEATKLAQSLLAARVGSRWPVEKSNGPAIAALAAWNSRSVNASQKYKLTVSVNDREIETLTIDPATDGSRRIRVPAETLHADRPQRIEFELDGRATFTYSATLTGFVDADKITSTTKRWSVSRRYEPAQRMFDGRTVPRGFGVVNGPYRSFSNPLTLLPVGDRGEVTLSPRRHQITGRIGEHYDYLVLTEPIPAGCSVLEGSVKGTFERYEIQPGQITFHIGNRRSPGNISYTLVGYVSGEYRVPQAVLRSFYEPSLFAVSKLRDLEVLQPNSEPRDEYRLTPDELYHLGEREFAKSNFDAAHKHLTELYTTWRLDLDKQKKAVQWLFSSSLAKESHGDSVKYFEVLKEKFPEVEISFEDILRVASSYRELGEYERSYLVYRATVEGSFERESQVAGFLNARGEFVRSVQAMERLLRDYPAESYVATATYALAQETYRRAPGANKDTKLTDAGVTRVHLIDGAIKMLDHFLTAWPEDPADDQASFALATALLDLEKYESAIERSEKYAQRYPNSRLLDSFWYMIGYSHFELEHPQEALRMCRKVADATFPVPGVGGTRPADNRWEAIYIMGQIHHSLGEAAQAIAEYTKVKKRFADAAEAIRFFNRQEIALDEVTTIKPSEKKRIELRFRNVAEAAIKVYRIDLMKFGLMQRNLDRITAINLAGIKPYHEETVKLGDGNDYRDRTQQLALPLKEEGAYLIVCRGEDLYTSGLALVSPLTLTSQEDPASGRVRVSVKDSSSDKFVSDVHVKVIGSENNKFNSGETDLRGLFIADDVRGTTTVIASSGDDRYAFYRGSVSLQVAPSPPAPEAAANDPFGATPAEPATQQMQTESTGQGSLKDNLFRQNGVFQLEQKGNYEELLNNDRKGVKSKEAY